MQTGEVGGGHTQSLSVPFFLKDVQEEDVHDETRWRTDEKENEEKEDASLCSSHLRRLFSFKCSIAVVCPL